MQQASLIDTALSEGYLVVLLERCPTGLVNARAAARGMSRWLAQFGPWTAGGLSRSATDGLAAAAAYRRGPTGVDVESLDSGSLQLDEARAFMHPIEQTINEGNFSANDALSIWVRKEAVLKAFGTGLTMAPDSLCVGSGDRDWKPVLHPLLGAAQVVTLCSPSGFVCAAAVRESCAPKLLVVEADSAVIRAH